MGGGERGRGGSAHRGIEGGEQSEEEEESVGLCERERTGSGGREREGKGERERGRPIGEGKKEE